MIKLKLNKIKNIIKGKEKKLIIIIGPCSIHNVKSTIKLAKIIKIMALKFKKKLLISMRVYFEKPRTTIGWKGFIYDPLINGSYKLKKGLKNSIKILKNINKIKLPITTEFLNKEIAIKIKNYISIGTIGARNCESQPHRELINYINIPTGIKNDPNGYIQPSINTIITNNNKNIFVTKKNKKLNILRTKKNTNTFLILRGGFKPNYKTKEFIKTINLIIKKKIKTGIIIDCSHGNSNKIATNQIKVINYIKKNFKKYKLLIGLMIETNLKEGTQNIKHKINKNISITDSCLSIIKTYKCIKNLYKTI